MHTVDFKRGFGNLASLTLQSLLFSISLLFSFSRFSLFFCTFFLSFPRISRFPRREKPLLFWGKTLAFSKKARIGGSGFGGGESAAWERFRTGCGGVGRVGEGVGEGLGKGWGGLAFYTSRTRLKTPLTYSRYFPGHLRPVIIKPVGRIFEISDSNPIRRKCGKCGRSLSPQKK